MQKGGKLILPITPKFHVLGGNYTITKTGSTTSYSSITLANTLNSKKKVLTTKTTQKVPKYKAKTLYY